jgi:hypothetical protein
VSAAEKLDPRLVEAAREELQRRAAAELEKRRETPEFKECVKQSIVARLHEKQREVLSMLMLGVRFIALCCSRRAGKTHLLASLIVLRLMDAGFNEEVVFCAPTLARGKELIWDELCKMIEDYHLGWKRIENTGKIRTPWGAKFRIIGLDNKRQIGKQRGGNCIAFFADECQEFALLLEQLLVAVGPALTQRRGWFIASGTPGPAKRGYWWKICNREQGFESKHWTLKDNPHLGRDGEEIIEEERIRNGWPPGHPTLMREFYGMWVDDLGMLVCEFLENRNIVVEIPDYDPKTWKHFVGVDYGFSPDPCAWVVAAAHPHSNLVAILHTEKFWKLTSDEIADKTNVIQVDFQARRIVGDSASGGSVFIEDFNKRYGRKAGVRMRKADKVDKKASIDMLNTELRTGRLVLVKGAADDLADELIELQWEDPEHLHMLPGEDHLFDALRYVLRAIEAYRANPKEEEPTEEQLEEQRILERNQRRQEQIKAQARQRWLRR